MVEVYRMYGDGGGCVGWFIFPCGGNLLMLTVVWGGGY